MKAGSHSGWLVECTGKAWWFWISGYVNIQNNSRVCSNLIFSKTAVTLSKSLSVVLVFVLEFHAPFDTKCEPSQGVKLRNETGGSSSLEESLHWRLNTGNITAVLL